MKLKDYRDDAHYFTSKLSDVNRKLAFAAIAIIWIFKVQVDKSYSLPDTFLWPMVLVVLGLGLDLLHYLYQSIVWTIFHRHYEKITSAEEDIKAPSWISNIAYFIFFMKVLAVAIGYILMIVNIFEKLFN